MSFSADLIYIHGSIVVALLLTGIALWKPVELDISRRRAAILGVSWCLLLTAEFWIFGPYSFVHFYDEADISTPFFRYLNDGHLGGRLTHGLGGGYDTLLVMYGGQQFVSLDRLLFAFPMWLAVILQKLIIAAVGFIGTYRLCRVLSGSGDRGIAVLSGALFTLSHTYLLTATTHHGLGYALLPLAIYVVIARCDAQAYFVRVTLLAALATSSTQITHGALVLGCGLVLAAVLLRPKNVARVILALAIIAAFLVVNWIDVLIGVALFAKESESLGERYAAKAVSEILAFNWHELNSKIHGQIRFLTVITLGSLIVLQSRKAGLQFSVLAVTLCIGSLLSIVPWELLGVGFLSAIRFSVIHFALPTIVLMVFAQTTNMALIAPRWARQWSNRVAPALLIALCASGLWYAKTYHAVNYVGLGGQALAWNVPNLKDQSWRTNSEARVVSLAHRFTPMFALNYGFETLDIKTAIPQDRIIDFWRHGIKRPLKDGPDVQQERYKHVNVDKARHVATELFVVDGAWADLRCCPSYSLDDFADVDFLRLMNVGYVLSDVPLDDVALRLVSGPDGPSVERSTMSFTQKLKSDFGAIFQPRAMYVYEIADPVPRAFFAEQIKAVTPTIEKSDLFDEIKVRPTPLSVVATRTGESAPRTAYVSLPQGDIKQWRKVRNGYQIDVAAPEGGVLVLNTLALPHWRVMIDGMESDVYVVNGIQLGVSLPPGSQVVEFAYQPPSLKTLVTGKTHGGAL